MLDIIGDIHGHSSELRDLLTKLGYEILNGIYKHPEKRQVIFLGDYIDRGPHIRETLEIVKGMTDAGDAIALMGNHEYNALAFAERGKGESYLRAHNEKNIKQHKATLEQFENYPTDWEMYKEWFYSLPLYLEKDGLRAVHACWDDDHIQWLKHYNHYTLTRELLVSSHIKNSEAYNVINDTLKGKEINIPREYGWKDKDGHWRTENRYKWWMDPAKYTYEHCVFNCPDDLKDHRMPADLKVNVYPNNAPPVFFGHYWLDDPHPILQAGNIACLDYSVAKEGMLVAYRFNGESVLDKNSFVTVNTAK